MIPVPLADHPTTAYARAVVAGDIPAGQLVRRACQRHLDDLVSGHERGITFDEATATRAISFFSFLPHIKGEWAKPGEREDLGTITLAPWQQFIVGSLFGWKRADGTRRYRAGYVEVPRKNGKSTLSSGIALLLAFFDGEPGAEVYAAATKRDQAKIVWGDAAAMVKRTPALRDRIQVFTSALTQERTASKFVPLGADGDTLDGLNIHGAIVDELHAHPSRKLVDVLETATGARSQPLVFYITTAGYDRHSVCWTHHEYSEKVLAGLFADDTWFTYIATIDEGDDWRDPAVWVKANPNYGISVKPDDLERKAARAAQMPTEQNAFRRLHLNVWTESATRWLDGAQWDACAGDTDPEDLAGRRCYAGLDLSSTTDLTALALVFPDGEGAYDVLTYCWVPENGIRRRAEKDRVPYPVWRDAGALTATDGDVVDYDVIRATLNELGDQFDIAEIAIDRWNSTQLQAQLDADGFTVVPFGQGFASMTAPTKELERLVLEAKLRHGGHPVLRWCASNVVVLTDPAGNIKPAKDKSTERIDAIVALVMAIGRAMVHPDGGSVYEGRGIITL